MNNNLKIYETSMLIEKSARFAEYANAPLTKPEIKDEVMKTVRLIEIELSEREQKKNVAPIQARKITVPMYPQTQCQQDALQQPTQSQKVAQPMQIAQPFPQLADSWTPKSQVIVQMQQTHTTQQKAQSPHQLDPKMSASLAPQMLQTPHHLNGHSILSNADRKAMGKAYRNLHSRLQDLTNAKDKRSNLQISNAKTWAACLRHMHEIEQYGCVFILPENASNKKVSIWNKLNSESNSLML
jgi:hypothetical protein